eukprot:1378383-Heterocapsa_arctica.AAC.1
MPPSGGENQITMTSCCHMLRLKGLSLGLVEKKMEDKVMMRRVRIMLGVECYDKVSTMPRTKKTVKMGPEHWRRDEDIETWRTIASTKAWHGVWHPAIKTQKTDDGRPGRSGVAVLVWKGRTINNSAMEADHRLVGAVVGWGRRKTIHNMTVYGLDTGQKNHEAGNKVLRGRIARHLAAIGRVPW